MPPPSQQRILKDMLCSLLEWMGAATPSFHRRHRAFNAGIAGEAIVPHAERSLAGQPRISQAQCGSIRAAMHHSNR
ncbi:hypothetical protein DdX_21118 [Ditylenchus destructor]|uniref:Uncharacterized protein n=1 Tax=Ditylenchus destructor TaxID=166010 RepID=A0AAD4MJL7_9BILA|nr:hypothetical protein DdX_21118 [Ditylenchus destructor]